MTQHPDHNSTPQNGQTQGTSAYPSAYGQVGSQPYQQHTHPAQQHPTGGYAQGHQTGAQYQQGYPQPQRPGQDSGATVGFFKALFDLKFEHFVTVKFATVIYILSILIAVLTWLGCTIMFFTLAGMSSGMSAYYGEPSGGGFMSALGFICLFLGWIPAVVQILLTRVCIEFFIASIRTAQNTTYLRQHR